MRNTLARVVGLVAWVLAGAVPAAGAGWPPENEAVQIVVPSPADTGVSISIARVVAGQLQQRLGGQFTVTAYPTSHGAGAAAYVASAPANGTMLLLCDDALADIAAEPRRDQSGPAARLMPIGLVAELPNILIVNNDLPVGNLDDFTRYVSRNPGVINFGSNGNGSAMHLAGQLYMTQTESNMVHVAYSASGQAMSNLISGQIQAMFHLAPAVLAQVRSHQVKALAVLSPQRLAALPDVPTAVEQGYPNLQSGVWLALMAPPGTPRELVERANHVLNDVLRDPEVRQQLTRIGALPGKGSPDETGQHIAHERKRWNSLMAESDLPLR